MASLSSSACSLSPTKVTVRPSCRRIGSTRAYASGSPPTMTARVPAAAAGTLPETGAASIAAPVPATRPARSRLLPGLIVLTSTYTLPACRPARIPSGPPVTAASASPSVTMLTMTSAASVTCRGVSHHRRPRPISGSAFALVRFVPYTRLPRESSRPAIWPPIAPRPTTPIANRLGFWISDRSVSTMIPP